MVAHLQSAGRIASRSGTIGRPPAPLAAAPLNSSFMVAPAGSAALYGARAAVGGRLTSRPNFDRADAYLRRRRRPAVFGARPRLWPTLNGPASGRQSRFCEPIFRDVAEMEKSVVGANALDS